MKSRDGALERLLDRRLAGNREDDVAKAVRREAGFVAVGVVLICRREGRDRDGCDDEEDGSHPALSLPSGEGGSPSEDYSPLRPSGAMPGLGSGQSTVGTMPRGP